MSEQTNPIQSFKKRMMSSTTTTIRALQFQMSESSLWTKKKQVNGKNHTTKIWVNADKSIDTESFRREEKKGNEWSVFDVTSILIEVDVLHITPLHIK